MQVCLTTAYFVHPPASICDAGMENIDQLSFQKGQTYVDGNLYKVPKTYDAAAKSEEWHAQNYFPGMGHHFVPPYPKTEDRYKIKPFQTLYAQTNSKCTISGFVWSHFSSTAAETPG